MKNVNVRSSAREEVHQLACREMYVASSSFCSGPASFSSARILQKRITIVTFLVFQDVTWSGSHYTEWQESKPEFVGFKTCYAHSIVSVNQH